MASAIRTVVVLATVSLWSAPAGASHSWSHWEYDVDVRAGEGLVLGNVKWKGDLILHSASVPVVRVFYDPACIETDDYCGPYNDHWYPYAVPSMSAELFSNAEQHAGDEPLECLSLEMRYAVGAYELEQEFVLCNDGRISPRVSSRRLSCNCDHVHHAYWRLDFDIQGAGHDEIAAWHAEATATEDCHGWECATVPASWRVATNEQDYSNDEYSVWRIRDTETNRSVYMYPNSNDVSGVADFLFDEREVAAAGVPNGASPRWVDGGARLYKYAESGPWPLSRSSFLQLPYGNHEEVSSADVVLWYVGHLYHEWEHDNPDEWHTTGPDIYVVGHG